MPTETYLWEYNIDFEKSQTLGPATKDEDRPMLDEWTLVLINRETRDQIRFKFQKPVRDFIVQQLTGLTVASDLPSI